MQMSEEQKRYAIRQLDGRYLDGQCLVQPLLSGQRDLYATGAGFMMNQAADGRCNCLRDNMRARAFYAFLRRQGVSVPKMPQALADITDVIMLKTKRVVQPDEELTFDYPVYFGHEARQQQEEEEEEEEQQQEEEEELALEQLDRYPEGGTWAAAVATGIVSQQQALHGYRDGLQTVLQFLETAKRCMLMSEQQAQRHLRQWLRSQ